MRPEFFDNRRGVRGNTRESARARAVRWPKERGSGRRCAPTVLAQMPEPRGKNRAGKARKRAFGAPENHKGLQ